MVNRPRSDSRFLASSAIAFLSKNFKKLPINPFCLISLPKNILSVIDKAGESARF